MQFTVAITGSEADVPRTSGRARFGSTPVAHCGCADAALRVARAVAGPARRPRRIVIAALQ